MGKRSKSKHSHRTGLCKQSKPERMSLILRTRHPEQKLSLKAATVANAQLQANNSEDQQTLASNDQRLRGPGCSEKPPNFDSGSAAYFSRIVVPRDSRRILRLSLYICSAFW